MEKIQEQVELLERLRKEVLAGKPCARTGCPGRVPFKFSKKGGKPRVYCSRECRPCRRWESRNRTAG